ncbi:MAG: hypothetical protein KF773_09545 [Deltaproteobacteria bacterium]|nr:hypothetical protein [Deltaproteobacteria bacterium]MCW5803811.1 hypothetical protein [Deltaproteobacteria bacterium]
MRWPVLVLLCGCHVVGRNDIARPGRVDRVRIDGAEPIPRTPTLVLTDDHALRFIEPLDCKTEEVVTTSTAAEIETKPNIATFVVGVVAASVGAVMTVSALGGKDASGDPLLYAGGGLALAGVPFAVGPFIGNRTELRANPDQTVKRPGPNEPCGERGLAVTGATLVVRGVEVRGKVDTAGHFNISPFIFLDAFEVSGGPSLDITAHVESSRGKYSVVALIDATVLAKHAAAWIKGADFDGQSQTIQIVPGVVAGTLRVTLTRTIDGPAVRIILPLRNEGPGPAWQLRGHVIAPGTPAIDGRVLYFGALAKDASVTRELLIPIAESVADYLRNAQIDLSIELRDAHGTAPRTPIRYRGPIMVDAPR